MLGHKEILSLCITVVVFHAAAKSCSHVSDYETTVWPYHTIFKFLSYFNRLRRARTRRMSVASCVFLWSQVKVASEKLEVNS